MCARNKCSKITQCLKKSIFEEKIASEASDFQIKLFALKIERKNIEKIKKSKIELRHFCDIFKHCVL